MGGMSTAAAFDPDHLIAKTPVCDPRRPRLGYRPLVAWRNFRALVRDKENTRIVFRIFEALPWTGMPQAVERLLATPQGRALRLAEPSLPDVLDDHDALRRMPAGSLAHAYCDFMEREGLTARGLVEEFEAFEQGREKFNDHVQWYMSRMRDTHDLQHVLTGYGRDALGEQCVLAFSYSQQPSFGNLFIAYAGGVEIRRQVKSAAPVLQAVREGQRLGRACPRLVELPVLELLPLPLDEVRRRLHISAPRHYAQAHAVWRGMGVDPGDLLGKAA